MEPKEKLQSSYINYVLLNGEQPKSVFVFARENELSEEEFYNYFGSFEGIEQAVWKDLMSLTIGEVKNQEVWPEYSAREKVLSLFFSFFELLKSKRSFAAFNLGKQRRSMGSPKVLQGLKGEFERFSTEVLQEGLESGELMDRPLLSKRYKDALWVQFGFVLNFWLKDTSAGFEKTDEAIEKGVNVTFDLFQRSPIDNLFEYGKFLAQNSGIKMPF
ncbi:TetR family transcriptional regulator C-terminal domain-containing protein [Pedobacter sp. SYSU D00535]|uniref:TetR family transcriptional regulator C-terminal domain-containing protein n=1 Tax=Pedobacter sp. SYSU D00535 TaxID=2810308 RepID=UPI001A973B7C|nr:TetR family transcriptional regulator C-terminal domain-containing protein [Pedobacter sp. SYSU D00535]